MSENSSTAAEQETLRQQISESRGALAEKLELLEEKVAESVQSATASVAEATASVVETVQNATASVSETVDNVNSAVQGTVESVRTSMSDTVHALKESLDLSEHVRQHPWPTVAGAVALGFVAGRLLHGDDESEREYMFDDDGPYQEAWEEYNPAAAFEPASWNSQRGAQVASYGGEEASRFRPRRTSRPASSSGLTNNSGTGASSSGSWMSQLKTMFHGEIEKIQGLAIGASLGLLRDVISQSAPPTLRSQITEIIDGMTEKMGGQKISEPVLSQDEPTETSR